MIEEKQKKQTQATGESQKRREKTPVWEWIIAGIGLILVVSAISFMIYEALTESALPPNFTFQIDSITPGESGHTVRFRVKNAGSETAADVEVEGELRRGAESVETSRVTLSYVASDSESEGGFIFSEDPNEYDFKIRAKSYKKP